MDSCILPRYDPLKYLQIRKLGSGVFGRAALIVGVVVEATHPDLLKHVAIKRSYRISSYQSRELEILEEIKGCENCLQLIDVFYSQEEPEEKSESKSGVIQNLVFEFLPINLDSLIDCEIKPYFFKFEKVRDLVRQLLTGLRELHAKDIIHRDIKPDNLFLDKPCKLLKIGDFGSAKKEDSSDINTPHCYSKWYRPPECLLGISQYTTAADIWAAGCVIFQIIAKVPLFPGKKPQHQFLEIMQVLGPLSNKDVSYFSKQMRAGEKELKSLSKIKNGSNCIFSYLPLKVYSYEQIEAMEELLSKMLRYNPESRVTAEEALKLQFFNI